VIRDELAAASFDAVIDAARCSDARAICERLLLRRRLVAKGQRLCEFV
jgi:hypothetical protein